MGVITKDHAENIVKKLGAKRASSRGRKAHDLYEFEHGGVTVVYLSVRRSPKRDKGHGHLPKDLHLSPHQTVEFARCNPDVAGYIRLLQDKGIITPEDGGEEADAS